MTTPGAILALANPSGSQGPQGAQGPQGPQGSSGGGGGLSMPFTDQGTLPSWTLDLTSHAYRISGS